jgi:hypothetical protein
MASRAFILVKEFVLGRRISLVEARITRKARNNHHFLHFEKIEPPAAQSIFWTKAKMAELSMYSQAERQMILGNPNVIMRLQRMLQAQQEFADAVAHAGRDLRDAQEQNYYGTPPLQTGGGRPPRSKTPTAPRKPRGRSSRGEDGAPILSRGIVYNSY